MDLRLTQTLTEINTRNISWAQRLPVRVADHLTTFFEFDIPGSLHLGNVYVRLRFQLVAHYIYSLFSYILFTCFGFYLHPSSGAQTAVYSHRYAYAAVCVPEDGCK
jgi:hypothetical protein